MSKTRYNGIENATSRCVAPNTDSDTLCSAPAVTSRPVGGVLCPLCARHASEFDHISAD